MNHSIGDSVVVTRVFPVAHIAFLTTLTDVALITRLLCLFYKS